MEVTPSSHAQKQKIHLLPEHIVNQIKAGEVIERPSSLIKEIIENSVDAKSSKIAIQIMNNGLDLISIVDDGVGINFADLPYAFCRHATSKIDKFEDLYRLSTFGFRGEALASIASISKLTCTSYPVSGEAGKIVIHGAEEISHTKLGGNGKGTSLFIKELFYNTPARLKFSKSQVSEKNSIKRILNIFLLVKPEIQFTIQFDNKDKKVFPAIEAVNKKKRIAQVFKLAQNVEDLHFIEKEYQGYRLQIYLSKKTSGSNANKIHYLFANDRYFIDKSLHQMIMRNLKPLWGEFGSGEYCIFLKCPTNEIDVNVHPNKINIKFAQYNIIYQLISSSLKEICRKSLEVTPTMELPSNEKSRLHLSPTEQGDSLVETSLSDQVDQLGFNLERKHDNYSLKQEIENDFFQLTDEFLVYRQSYLVSLKAFARQTLIDAFTAENINDDQVIPLLISAPLNMPVKFSFDQKLSQWLKTKGFEIDQLDQKLLAVRSIPKSIEFFHYKEFLVGLILHLSRAKSKNFDQAAETYLTRIDVNLPTVTNLMHFEFDTLLANKKIAKKISNSLLNQLFDL